LIVSYAQLGHALSETGGSEKGLSYIRKAGVLTEAEPAQTPLIQTFKGIIQLWSGEALERGGKIDVAVQYYTKGKEILRAVHTGNPTDLRAQIYYSSAIDRLGAALLRLGRTEDAQREFDQSLAMLDPLFRSDANNQEVLYALAETYTSEGRASAKLAERSRAPGEKLTNWTAARDWFQKSLDIWSKVSNPARISTSGLECILPDEVGRRLAKCDAQIASLKNPVQSSHSAAEWESGK
jgi:tetratricopeptide (TPR) repeat protein